MSVLASAGKGKPLPAIVERVQNGSTVQVLAEFVVQVSHHPVKNLEHIAGCNTAQGSMLKGRAVDG